MRRLFSPISAPSSDLSRLLFSRSSEMISPESIMFSIRPLSTSIRLWDRSSSRSLRKPTTSWSENSCSRFSLKFALIIEQRAVQVNQPIARQIQLLQPFRFEKLVPPQLTDLVVLGEQLRQMGGAGQQSIERPEPIAGDAQVVEILQKAQLARQLLELIVLGGDHHQIRRSERQLTVQRGQIVLVDEQQLQLVQMADAAVQRAQLVHAELQRVNRFRQCVRIDALQLIVAHDQMAQVLQMPERVAGDVADAAAGHIQRAEVRHLLEHVRRYLLEQVVRCAEQIEPGLSKFIRSDLMFMFISQNESAARSSSCEWEIVSQML
uniref:Uncharacterized protein n=1 Tax=Anopheles merus TaxID=30066 RepID=A0A182VGA5_ANOME